MTSFVCYGRTAPFSAEVIADDCDCDIVSYCYPGAIRDAWVPGITVKVSHVSGEQWLGSFLQGKESPNAIDLCCIHPDGERLIVVAKGAGYIVSPMNPAQWEEISLRPIVGHGFDEESNTLVLFDFTRVMGIGGQGRIWKTSHLSWDGLADIEISQGSMTGKGWDASESKLVSFSVRLSDGCYSGGASPPSGTPNRRS